jgi:hypothetical protein
MSKKTKGSKQANQHQPRPLFEKWQFNFFYCIIEQTTIAIVSLADLLFLKLTVHKLCNDNKNYVLSLYMWSWLMLISLFRSFGFLAHRDFKIILLSNLSILSIYCNCGLLYNTIKKIELSFFEHAIWVWWDSITN